MLITTFFLMPLMGNTALASDQTYYFNSFDENEAWETDPEDMVDGDPDDYASTTTLGDVELCDGNTCIFGIANATTLRVELRVKGYADGAGNYVVLRPVFNGTTDGSNYSWELVWLGPPDWSQWFDITEDTNAPERWTWQDVANLDCDVEAIRGEGSWYISIVEIRVTYE